MEVLPAIDLRGGRCVRLRQGDFAQETIFGDDPVAMAMHWQSQGATRLHLVDLDGAREGRPAHLEILRRIASTLLIPCQLGGGMRDTPTVEAAFEAGIDRVVVGTQAIKDPAWFRELVARYPKRVALGIDARSGKVATEGWLDTSSIEAIDLAARFDDLPLAAVIYTDIARDGMLEGPNLEATAELALRLRAPVIASGGVSSIEDIRALARLPLAGCIVGRALYDGRFALADAIAMAQAKSRTAGDL
jgi:phosphoribosylformimino-5-aminoimidazole carboxamide ribotide isomerase